MRKGYIYAFLFVLSMVSATILNSIFIVKISNIAASLISVLTVLFILGIQRIVTGKKIIHKRMNRNIFLIGIFNLIGLLTMYEGVRLLGASSYEFVSRLSIVFSLFIGIYLLKEKTKVSYLGIGLTLVGIVIMQFSQVSTESILGVLVTTIFALSISIGNALAKVEKDYTTDEKLLYNNLICVGPLMIMILFTGDINTLYLEPNLLLIFFGTSALSAYLGMKFYFESLRHIDFSTVTIIQTISPVLTLIISDVILQLRPITDRKIIGGTVVVLGILLVVRKKIKK